MKSKLLQFLTYKVTFLGYNEAMHGLDGKVKDKLDRLEVTYHVLPCDAEFADTAAFCEQYGYSPSQAANTILVASKTDPVQYLACVVLATTKLDVNKKIRELTGVKRWSFASGDQTLELSGMMIGGVTAFGLPDDLMVYIDSAVMEKEEVIMGGGNRSSKLLLSPQEIQKLPSIQVVNDLAIPR